VSLCFYDAAKTPSSGATAPLGLYIDFRKLAMSLFYYLLSYTKFPKKGNNSENKMQDMPKPITKSQIVSCGNNYAGFVVTLFSISMGRI
jgi:hypothetical protein